MFAFLLTCALYRQSLFGRGTSLQGGYIGRKVDNSIKSLVFVWRNRRYRRTFQESFGFSLPNEASQVGVPVLQHSYLVESLYRTEERSAFQANLTTLCPACLFHPLVGRWYHRLAHQSANTSHTQDLVVNQDLTVVAFQESELEEWMDTHFGSTDHTGASLWEVYTSWPRAEDRVQFAALLMVLTYGGAFVGPTYNDKMAGSRIQRSKNNRTRLMLERDTYVIDYLHVSHPMPCLVQHMASYLSPPMPWPEVAQFLIDDCPKLACCSSENGMTFHLRDVPRSEPQGSRVTDIVQISGEVQVTYTGKQHKEHELIRQNCWVGWLCHRCLRLPWRGSLDACQAFCNLCYAKVLGQSSSVQDVVYEAVWKPSSRPSSSTSTLFQIPRIIHQTWFEELTTARYPHLTRLQNSWKASGWDYRFYTDATARAYLCDHYPTRFVDAYDSLIPGAFRADLFRLLVLLREGGVYADVDVQLDADLDSFLEAPISFFIPRDCPLDRWPESNYCLWNGFMGSRPGHPILLQAVEDVMNHVLNRQDYYDLEGQLIEHNLATEVWKLRSIPILLLTGPCALGISVNKAAGLSNPLRGFPVGWLPDMEENVLLLHTDRYDTGELRFTDLDRNLLIASTNADGLARQPIPRVDEMTVPKSAHYSENESEIVGAYGVYRDNQTAGERIRLRSKLTVSVDAHDKFW